MRFLDNAKIFVCSGAGGNGCVGFRRARNEPRGGPDGGDGGKGGSVIALGTADLNTLIDFRYKQHFVANNGGHGRGRQCNGAAGSELIIKLPLGTQIFEEDNETLISDIVIPKQRVILASGGLGGFGNNHYKSSTNRAPRRADSGRVGQERWLWLQLKLLADAGIVGLPNAGKSTFLSTISDAKPKIAEYPFTTLTPQLGVVLIDGFDFVVADVPGLIENAHLGAGLGDRFLSHLERCTVLAHLVDGTENDPSKAYYAIRKELDAYGGDLSHKPEVILLSKCDSLTPLQIDQRITALKDATKQPVIRLSSVSGEGIKTALRILSDIIKQTKKKNNVTSDHQQSYNPILGLS